MEGFVRTLLHVDTHTVVVGTSGTTARDVIAVARGNARVELSAAAVGALAAAREIVDALAAGPEPVYGVSTGFGALAARYIGQDLRGGSSATSSARTPRAWARGSSARSSAR